MTERAYAKLNLSLDVLGKNPNGYHDLRMVMQSVEFGDDVSVELRADGRFTIDPGQPFLPRDDRNLALKAAKLFLAGSPDGADIRIAKRTPICAGMGGGSSDAAAVLRILNRLTGARKTDAELRALAEQVGSDEAYCVTGGTRLAEGRGEILTPLPPLPDCAIVICKPAFAISTPSLFARIDARKSRLHPDTAGLMDALAQRSLSGVARRMYNVFEDVLDKSQAEIGTIRSALIAGGALGAVMTGTGSAVFGLFDDDKAANTCYCALREQYKECYRTRPAGETVQNA